MRAEGRWEAVVAAAGREGLLTGPVVPAGEERPWPVVLLTAFGAWLAAIPLFGFTGLVLVDLVQTAGGPFVVGLGCLAVAVAVLRGRGRALFVEQLAIPVLLVGGGTFAFGLYRDVPGGLASALMLVVALGLALAVPQAWLRTWLGGMAAGFLGAVLAPPDTWFEGAWHPLAWWATHALVAAWLVAIVAQRAVGSRAAAVIEPLAAGWILTALAGLAVLSGMTFLAGAATTLRFWDTGSAGGDPVQRGLSAILAAAAFVGLAWKWAGVRHPGWGTLALVGMLLASRMDTLGAVLLVLAACVATGRWRLASASGLAAAWIIGAFYHAVDVPLADKALLLVAAGAIVGAIAWWMSPARRSGAPPAGAPARAWPAALIPVTVVLCLLVANVGIWQKEAVIARGRLLLVELGPVDPRSLMQGDYMTLNFSLPPIAVPPRPDVPPPHVVMQVDEHGVARVQRVELPGESGGVLAPRELRFVLTARNGRWVFVTDAWFFKEGDGPRFAAARYGEFRITADGEAVLVGLRDTRLAPIPR